MKGYLEKRLSSIDTDKSKNTIVKSNRVKQFYSSHIYGESEKNIQKKRTDSNKI